MMETEFELQVGGVFSVFRNQAEREATVLAVIGNEALIEYSMPRESTALNIVPNPFNRDTEYNSFGDKFNTFNYKTISYNKVPTKWLKEMVRNDIEWVGHPQGTYRVERRYGREHVYEYQKTPTAKEFLITRMACYGRFDEEYTMDSECPRCPIIEQCQQVTKLKEVNNGT